MIIWGTTIKRKRLGRVADFCPICRVFRPFGVTRVGSAGHIYFISIGQGALVGHEKTCEKCRQTLEADLSDYADVSKDTHDNWPGLLEATCPGIEGRYATRLELEQRVRQKRLTDVERAELIREPFMLINSQVEVRAASTNFDWQSGFGLLLIILLLFLGLPLALAGPPAAMYAWYAAGGAVGIFTSYSLFTDVRRYMRACLHPILLKALQPLDPTFEELTTTLQTLKSMGLAVGKKVQPRLLYDELSNVT